MPSLLPLLLNKVPEDMVDTDRCKRGADESDEKLFRVLELGVEGFINAGTSEESAGEEDLRLAWERE